MATVINALNHHALGQINDLWTEVNNAKRDTNQNKIDILALANRVNDIDQRLVAIVPDVARHEVFHAEWHQLIPDWRDRIVGFGAPQVAAANAAGDANAARLAALEQQLAAEKTARLALEAANADSAFIELLQSASRKVQSERCTEGMHARMAKRDGEWVNIGYFDGSSWMSRRWAFAPLPTGRVPAIDGDKIDSGKSTWLKNHEVGHGPMPVGWLTGTRYFSTNSGENGSYASASDKNGQEYLLIPANGDGTLTGYVPARTLQSLKKGYEIDPNNYNLVCDKNKILHLACNNIEYQKHGFELHGKIWWPVKNGNFANRPANIDEQEARMDVAVQKHCARETRD